MRSAAVEVIVKANSRSSLGIQPHVYALSQNLEKSGESFRLLLAAHSRLIIWIPASISVDHVPSKVELLTVWTVIASEGWDATTGRMMADLRGSEEQQIRPVEICFSCFDL